MILIQWLISLIFVVTVMTFVSQPARSAAPHTPRVLLIGSRGSGKTTQAAMLSAKYRIVDGSIILLSFIYFSAISLDCIIKGFKSPLQFPRQLDQ